MTKNTPTKSVKSRVRISDEMRQCVELMATEGLPVQIAAERANITRSAAVKNMRKPHILKLLNQRIAEVRDNAAQEAYLRINNIALTSKSERIALDASRWVAGVDGIAPVQRMRGQVHHRHSFAGFEYPDLEPTDVTPDDQS